MVSNGQGRLSGWVSMRRRLALFSIGLASVGLHPELARAAWPSDPQVNVPLSTAAGSQNYPTIVSDGAGGAIVTWQDSRTGGVDVYAQRVNAGGAPQWTADGVALCTAPHLHQYPSIASDGAGGAIVTWYDNRDTTDHIYAQRVNAAGVPQWTADGVALCTAANNQAYPTIVSDGAGGAILTWFDYRNGLPDIYAQRVNGAGVAQWTANGVALCTAANSQVYPAIAPDGAGGAIVTWYDSRNGPYPDIYAQRVNAAGVPQWTADGVALCTAAFEQLSPTIVSDGAGGAIVAWYDSRNGAYTDIYAQRVDAAGVPQWTADGVALCTAANNQLYPVIAPDGAGGAIVVWFDYRSGTNSDIYAQRVNAAGAPQWAADGVALCSAASDQLSPTIVPDGAGGAIVTWYDYRSGNSDIYAQRVNAAGAPQWITDGVAVGTAAQNKYLPTITSDEAGGAIVTWYDQRDGTNDIYAQNIRADGTLGGTLLSAPPFTAANFALRGIQPNPSVGDFHVSFSLLDDTPATLDLYDLTGRRIESLSVGGLGPGAHVTSLNTRSPTLPPGIYCVSLTQGSRRAFRKVAIVR